MKLLFYSIVEKQYFIPLVFKGMDFCYLILQVSLTPSSQSLIPFCLYFVKGESILADSGTEQLEFIALSQRTGDPKYQQKVFNFHSICSIFSKD